MLSDINFSELYIGSKQTFMGGAGRDGLKPLENSFDGEISELRTLCEKEHDKLGRDEFPIKHGNIVYRVSYLQSIADTIFVLRKFPSTVPELRSFNLHQVILQNLMTKDLTGLLLICGAYSSGKTTTASAIVKERIDKIGGVAVTIEDPPEMPLEGVFEKGVCFQTWAEDGDFSLLVKKSARYAPSILFLGEIRDGKTALEALKAATNGILVIASFHASSIEAAMERFHTLASDGKIGPSEVASLIANSLSGILHQSLVGEKDNKRLEAKSLWVPGANELDIRNTIRAKQWTKIDGFVKFQRNSLYTVKTQ